MFCCKILKHDLVHRTQLEVVLCGTIMQLETDTNILVRSKPMHMPIYILGHVYGLKLILFSGMGRSNFRQEEFHSTQTS